MDRNNSTGPVVDMSAIAATFPGQNLFDLSIVAQIFFTSCEMSNSLLTHFNTDLTSEERQLLLDIRRRKAELLQVGP